MELNNLLITKGTRSAIRAFCAAIVSTILICSPGLASEVYENKPCGYYFDLPHGWSVLEDPHDQGDTCVVRLRPADFEARLTENPVDLYSIYLHIKPKRSDAMSFLTDSGVGFKLGSFTTPGRFGLPYQAIVRTNERWSIVQGNAVVGCHHHQGSYVGTDCREVSIIAFANGQENDFGFSMTGPEHSRQIIDHVLDSFEFSNIKRDEKLNHWGDHKHSD